MGKADDLVLPGLGSGVEGGSLHLHCQDTLCAALCDQRFRLSKWRIGRPVLFGFTAIALGLVGYVTTLFKLSALFTILWARLFLGEGQMRSRFLGACVMVVGGGLVAA
jgi:hypothetical protein